MFYVVVILDPDLKFPGLRESPGWDPDPRAGQAVQVNRWDRAGGSCYLQLSVSMAHWHCQAAVTPWGASTQRGVSWLVQGKRGAAAAVVTTLRGSVLHGLQHVTPESSQFAAQGTKGEAGSNFSALLAPGAFVCLAPSGSPLYPAPPFPTQFHPSHALSELGRGETYHKPAPL